MTEQVQGVLSTALGLSVDERAELAAVLLASLDGEADKDVEAAWVAEIVQRINKVRDSGSSGRDWRDIVKDLRGGKS